MGIDKNLVTPKQWMRDLERLGAPEEPVNTEFYWDGRSPFFEAGDAIVPAMMTDMTKPPDDGTGWAADIALGESPILIEFFAGDPDSAPWLILSSPLLEERYGHYLWIRVVHDCIVVGDWEGETEDQRYLNVIFKGWKVENLDVEGFLKWLYRLQRMRIVIDPDLRYFDPRA